MQPAPPPNAVLPPERVTAYHWLVVLLAAGGWLFDCMGQRIFVLGREPALKELLGATASDAQVQYWGGVATLTLMIGWATGGIFFGMLSDHWGRVKVMVASLLAYTVFSGASGFAHGVFEFLAYRLLFGIGVGGMFGAATTLVAESVPPRFRTLALGSLQSLSACGNMTASLLSLKIIPGQENYWGHFSGWQALFFAGVAPVVLALPMLILLREPEVWRRARAEAAQRKTPGKGVGAIADLFHPRWRRGTLVGIGVGVAGMVGLWGIAYFSPELISTAFKTRPLQPREIIKPAELFAALQRPQNDAAVQIRKRFSPGAASQLSRWQPGDPISGPALAAVLDDLNRLIQEDTLYDAATFAAIPLKKSTQNLVQLARQKHDRRDVVLLNRQLVEQTFPGTVQELQKTIQKNRSRGTILQDCGALAGMFGFTFLAGWLGRRRAFLFTFGLCVGSVVLVFCFLKSEGDTFWMLPLLGFATLAPFAGYSIYFPELFPTRLRGTGVGFCYNTVRYLAAPFPFLLGWLSTLMPFRSVAVAMSAIYLLGIVALLWAPETKGQPLPED
jgi:MFS family permease